MLNLDIQHMNWPEC